MERPGGSGRFAEALPVEMDVALREALLDLPDVGVAFCDQEGLLLASNAEMQRLLDCGYRRSLAHEWPGQFQLYDEHGERLLAPGEDPLARALAGEYVAQQLMSVRTASGTRILRCRAHVLSDGGGACIGGVVFAVDATRPVLQHRKVIALREKLIETVNHELRTPLAAAKGHLELLHDAEEGMPASVRWSLQALARGIHRLEAVVDSLREITDAHRLEE